MKKTLLLLALLLIPSLLWASGGGGHTGELQFPLSLDAYHDSHMDSVSEKLSHRMESEPLNLWASLIFACAIFHTFLAAKFTAMAHHWAHEHEEKIGDNSIMHRYDGETIKEVSFKAELFHFLGEVEVVFGMWTLVLMAVISSKFGFSGAVSYIDSVNFTEPMFVVVIMTLAATRPVIQLSKQLLGMFAKIGKSTPAAWWFSILTVAPLLGSFITEPAAMTIGALLLSKQFYHLKPTKRFAYATIGLLFVNVSVGGTLTHFAAPPVLMVATKWNWDMAFMATNFGWKAALGILISNSLYYVIFKKDFSLLEDHAPEVEATDQSRPLWDDRTEAVPLGITVVHVGFLAWTVLTAHHPVLFIGGFLFALGFLQATGHHQNRLDLKPSLLVGFFLAGLVIHGGLQAWWIAPILASLGEVPLMIGATVLTAFNDNAAVTYLASLVPGFGDNFKYAVVAGAVTGGGLTVIANAPNPAGQSILARYFDGGVNPLFLAASAIVPTIIVGCCFMML
ncbi:MAG: putative Na+/H+ antiporter [SAR324 cluster bacterium]|nr:putative Na+/H+ antiporter [SAR324 cluster bacterium]